MDQLEFAIRQFDESFPMRAGFDGESLNRGDAWYEEDVAPALQPYLRRPYFRQCASWPIVKLASDSKSDVRKQIDRVDRAIIRCAQQVKNILDKENVQSAIAENLPSYSFATSGTVTIDEDEVHSEVDENVMIDPGIELKNQISRIADRPWDNLVNIGDYFGTQPVIVASEPNAELGINIAIPLASSLWSVNPRLLPVGNFIVRGMQDRIRSALRVIRKSHDALIDIGGVVGDKRIQSISNAKGVVDTESSRLEELLTEADATRSIETCMALTQIYAAIKGGVDLEWLGFDQDTIERGAEDVKVRLRSLRGPEITDRVVVHLRSLKQLYQNVSKGKEELDDLIATKDLVLDVTTNECFWIGDEFKLSDKQFLLLKLLVQRSRSRQKVTGNDLDPLNPVDDSALSSMVNRMKDRIPGKLSKLIRAVPKEGYFIESTSPEIAMAVFDPVLN